jgi:uridine nucleosidase
VDDTLAILLALRSPELEVVGLTAVFGNSPVENTAQNARRILEIAGFGRVPAASGAARPLVRTHHRAPPYVHGADGLGDSHLPPPRDPPLATPAAQFIVEQVRAQPGEITLVALGPQTNLALALRLEPGLPALAQGFVFMGGAAHTHGNVTAVAEANIWGDPEAADAVLEADWPATMVGLDVTRKTVMRAEYIEELGRGASPVADLLRRIFPVYQAFYDRLHGLVGATYTHDPSAIAYLIDPGLFRAEQAPVFVETQGRCAGQTVPDPEGRWGERPAANVCLDVDSARLLDLIRERVVD